MQRSDEICQLFQKGRCDYGDRCYKTHIFQVPQACITQLLPRQPKAVARKVSASLDSCCTSSPNT